MKMKSSLLLFLLFFIALHTTLAQRFWVGNTGNWNNTANWSTTSGGIGGASVPTATDDVFFDAASNGVGTLPFTVTLDVAAICNTLNFTGIDAALTMDGANGLTVNGNVTTVTNWSPTFTGAFVLAGATAAATNTINFTGQSFDGGIQVNATANNVTWQATAGTITTTTGVLLRRGTLDTNGRPLSAVSISANDAGNQDRGLTLGASALTLTGTGTVIDFTDNAATFTLSSGTSTVTINNAGNTTVITGNSTKTMPNLNFSVVGGIAAIQTSGVAANTITFGTISTAKATFNVTGTGAIAYGNTITLPASVTANFGGGNATFANALTLPNSAIITFNNTGTNTFNTTLIANAGAGSSLSFTNIGLNTFTGAVTLNSLTNTINNTGANAFAALNTGAGTATTFGTNVTNNTFGGAVAFGGTNATFNNTGTNNFAAAATIGVTTGTVAFSNNGNTYNENITLAAGTTWRFSGTGISTVAATANMILNGSCVTPPTNYVTVNANTGTANVTFANAQTWANAVVANLNVTGTVTVNQGYTDGGGNTNVTFSPLATSRTLFWVGGTGNWNSEANWSLTSGGAGGQCIPTIEDDVIFDAASGGAGFVTTFNVAAICRSATFTGVNAMTLAGTNTWTVAGNLTLVANVTTSFTGKLIFDDNLAGVNTIIGAAKVIVGGIDFNSSVTTPATASWQMTTSGLGAAGTGALALINGTLNTNGQPLVGTVLNANPAGDLQRALTLGASAITLTGTATVLDLRSAGNNLTLTSGTATVTMNNAAALVVETGNSTKTLPNLAFSVAGATATINISTVAANTITFGTINSTKTNISVVGASSVAYPAVITLVNNTTSTWGGNNATFTQNRTFPNGNIVTFNNTGTNTFSGTFTANAGAGSSLTFSNGGANTFTGNVALNALTKNINNTGTNTFSGTFTSAGTTTVFGANVTNNTFTGAATLSSTTSVTYNNTGNNAFGNTLTVSSPTTSFNNTAGTNTFTGAVALNGANTNFSNATNNFNSTIAVATNNILTFNNTTNNTFAGNITANANSTLNFSTRAGTSNTFTGAAIIVTNGNCSNPPTSFVKIKSPVAGTQARLTFVTGHTWSNTTVQDINVVGGGAIVASAANADAGNNTGNITFTSSATGTGRNLFWVGGTGNWNDINRWSLTSGGAGGECVPTIFDNVNFDGGSGTGYTVTLNTPNPLSKSVNFTGANAMTLAGAATVTWTVGGNFNMNNPNVTQTGIGATFLGTIIFTKSPNFPVAAQGEVSPATIDMGSTAAARQFANITFDDIAAGSTGGVWTLTSALNTIDPAVAATTDGFLQLLGGTLNTNGQTIRCRTLSAFAASNRNLNISSPITITGKDADRTPTINLNSDVLLLFNSTPAGAFNMTNSQGGGGAITLETGSLSKTLPHLNYSGSFDDIYINSSNVVANTITINQLTVASNINNFSLSGNSQKNLVGAVAFNGTIVNASDWNGNTTFNATAPLTFANTVTGFTFNGTVTSSANITSSGNNSVLNFANTFTHNATGTFSLGFANTVNFTGTVSNTFSTITGVSVGQILNFNNTGNNTFNGVFSVGSSSIVNFTNSTDNNTFNANLIAGSSSTLRFSTNAGTSNTFVGTASLVPLGNCSSPTASYVNIRSSTNGTVARVTFGSSQVWNHVLITDIDNILGQTITVNAIGGDGGNNSNIMFIASTTGRTLYWSQRGGVAGSQNWSDPNSWSLSPTGLPVGECPPTVNDIVIVNDNAYTVNGNTMNIDVVANCRTFDWQITTAGRNPIINGTLGLRIAENLILPLAAVGANFSGLNTTITLSATIAPTPIASVAVLIGVNRIIQSNGTTTLTNANLTINDTGVGVTWTLENDFTLGTNNSGGILTLTQGHLKTINTANTTAHNLTVRRLLATGTAVRALTFANAGGGSTVNVTDDTGATVFDISGTAITTNATNAGVAPFSTINFTGNAASIINLGTLNLALGNFNVTGTTAKTLTVNTPTTPQTLTFNNIDIQTLTDITFNGTSPKTINNLTVRTPNTTIGFDITGNTIVNGLVDFNTNVITRFRNTATFQTSADVIDYGVNGVGIYDGLLTTNRTMTFATSTAATLISLTTNAGMNFNNANLIFGSSANNTTAKEIENIGACTFTGTSNIVFDNNFNATFGGGAGTNNTFRDILANVGGNTADILFSNTGTNSLQNVTIRDGSTWAFSTGGVTSVTGLFRVIAICTARVNIISNLAGTCANTNFATAGQTWDNIGLLRDVANAGSPITINTAVNPTGVCTTGFNTTTQYRNLFWVGRAVTSNWGDPLGWSLTSGGAGGECPPTINDDVNFDANSFSAAGQSCILTGLGAGSFYECRNMNWTGATNNPAFNQNNTELTIAGNLTFIAGMTFTNTAGRVVFNPQSDIVIASRTITMVGKTFGNQGVYFRDLNAAPGTWTLQDAFATTNGIFLAGGTLTTNNQTVAATLINANPNAGAPFVVAFTRGGNDIAVADRDRARTLNLGSSVVTLNGGTSTIMDFRGNTANFTLNAGTSQIILSNTAASTRTIELGTVAKNLYNLRSVSPAANVTITVNAPGAGTYGFNDVEFLNTGGSTVTVNVNNNTSAKTFNSILFGNNTVSTFTSSNMTVATTTTYGTNTRTTVNPTTSATFTGLVTVGSTTNVAGAADFQRATFNAAPTSLTYTSLAGQSRTIFTNCTVTNATTSATPNAEMLFQGNNTFVPTTGTLTFATTSTPVTLQSNTAGAGTQIFGGAVLIDAAGAGTATINLTGNTLFNNGLTVNSNTATATIGNAVNGTSIFKEAVSFNGNQNTVNLISPANAAAGYVAFTDALNISSNGMGVAGAANVTTNGIVFFRNNVNIGVGSIMLVANNIVFNGRIDQRNAPLNWGTSTTPLGVSLFTTTVFTTPKTWIDGNTTDNTTGTSAGATFTIGADNRVSFAGAVDCGLRNISFGNRTICNITNTGAAMAGLHTFDNITLNPFVYFQIPSRDIPVVGLNPVVRVTNLLTANPTCSEWVSISSTTSGVRGSFCFKINQNWQRVIVQDIQVLPAGCAAGFNGVVAANNSQDAGNNLTVGTTITFSGTFGTNYYWMGGRAAAMVQDNNWSNWENWSLTYPGYSNPTQCTPTAGDAALYTDVSFPNNTAGTVFPAAFGSYCDINVPFAYIKDMIWIPDTNNNGMANTDTTITAVNVSGVYHTGANNMARLRNVNVPAATIEVYGRIKLPGGVLNQFTGTFSMQSAGLGGGTQKAIQNPKAGQFFGALVFNAADIWYLTDNIDCNNNANGSITMNLGQLLAKGNNITLQGNFTINLPPSASFTQNQIRYDACSGSGGGMCNATVTFDGIANNQTMSLAGVTGCNNTYDCAGNANICAVSPFNNLVINKRNTFPSVTINTYSITVNKDLTITKGELIDNGNQIRGNSTGNLTLEANTALRLGQGANATVFPTCYRSNRISLSSGTNGALAAQTLANGAVSTAAADSSSNASIVEYRAEANQLIRGRVTAGSADPGALINYGTLIVAGGLNGTTVTKRYKDLLNEVRVSGSLIVRTGAVLRDMGYQITGSAETDVTNCIRVEGSAQLYLGTAAAATLSTTYQPVINANVANAFQTPTATANAVTTFPTFTPIGNIGAGGKMDLNNTYILGTMANSPTIDGVAAGGANLDQSAYSTVVYAADANQNVLAGFTYGNLALTNASAARIKTITGATLGTTTLALGGNLLIQANHEFRDAGFQIIGNGNTDAARIAGTTSTRVARIRMEASTILRLGITRAAATDINTFFPTYISTAGAPNFLQGTPVANRNNNNRSLDATSTVIYDAGLDLAVGAITNQRLQRVDGGFTYGNMIISNSAAPTGNKVLALKCLDADLGTPASNGIVGNLTITSYNYLWDNNFQINRTAAGGVFTMQAQSAIRFGGNFNTLGGAYAGITAGGATTTFPTNFANNTNGRIFDITSVQVYGRAGNQDVAGGNVLPAGGAGTSNFYYGSLMITGTGTKQNTTNANRPFINANLYIDTNATYSDNGAQIFGNTNVTTASALSGVINAANPVSTSAATPVTVTMQAGSNLILGNGTRLTTFPMDYDAARMGTTNLATTSTVTYNGGYANATSANRRQIIASGFSYGNLVITNPNSAANVSEKWVARTTTATTGASTSGAWIGGLFTPSIPATVGTRVATGATVEVKNNFTINTGNMVYDDGIQINGPVTPSTGTFLMQEAAATAVTELYLGNAATVTIFPDRFATINLTPNFAPSNRKNTVIYNSDIASNIAGTNSAGTAFAYGNLRLSSTANVTKSLSSSITVRGNLTIDGATATTVNTLDFNTRNIRLSGDWITGVNALFVAGTGTTVTFDGNFEGFASPTPAQSQFQTLTLRPTATTNRFANVTFDNRFNSVFNIASGTAIRLANIAGNHIRLTGVATFTNGHVGNDATSYPHPIVNSAAKTTFVAGDIPTIATTVSTNYLMFFEAAATSVGTNTYQGLGATNPGNNSHVIGSVQKVTTAGQNFVFPVGNGGSFAPIGVISPSASNTTFGALYIPLNAYGTLAAPVYPTGPPTVGSLVGLSHASSVEFWQLDRISGASSAQVLLGWDTPRSGGVNILGDMRVAHWGQTVANAWNSRGNAGTLGTINQGVITSSDVIAGFSPFTLGSIIRLNPLPVTLLNFNAKPKDKASVEIMWETIEERTNSFFTIERSLDGLNFAAIKTVPSKAVNGNSTSNLSYVELDTKPYKGVSYYRLRQTDIDGKTTHSRIVVVNFDGNGIDPTAEGFVVYPNPNDGKKVNLKFTDVNFDRAEIGVLDMMGREIYQTTITKNGDIFSMDFLSSLAAGQYVIRFVTDSGKVYNRAFVVE